ncbi:HTH-type transcriptional repressor PurR [compost metagenome]
MPQDISIIGFDDHTLSRHYLPALSTIRVDFSDMMDRLTRVLIESIENGAEAPVRVEAGTELIVRASCSRIGDE